MLRPAVPALVTWTSWHDSLPAAVFSEEFCEAGLSRLGRSCTSNPNMVTVQEMQNLYLLIRGSDTAPKDLPGGQVRGPLVDRVRAHLRTFVVHGPAVMGYVPWRPGRTCVAQQHWPEVFLVPGSLWRRPAEEHVDAVMRYGLYRMTRSPVVDGTLRAALRETFGRKDPVARRRDEAALRALPPVVIAPTPSRLAHTSRLPSARMLQVGGAPPADSEPPRRHRTRPRSPRHRHLPTGPIFVVEAAEPAAVHPSRPTPPVDAPVGV